MNIKATIGPRPRVMIDLMSIALLLNGSIHVQDGIEIEVEGPELEGRDQDEILDAIRDCMEFDNEGQRA